MTGPPDPADRRLDRLVEEFHARLLAGDDPDPSEVILAHPELAAELEHRLGVLAALHECRVAPPGPQRAATERGPSGEGSPTAVGRFRVLGELGRGASSVVYRAFDPRHEREVALKVLHPGTDFVLRFDRDARVAGRLRHHNIVPLLEAGEAGGLCYLAMELIEGESLEGRLRRNPLSFRDAAELVCRVAEALEHAHRHGVVHRDVKPSNILLDPHGQPQLTDFGLARATDGRDTLTAAGQVLGTPAYMSPEQAAGRAHEADGRTDVYSLGVVLYRLLTGRLPFDPAESVPALLYHVVHSAPPPPGVFNPAVPRDLELICGKAMEKDPRDRFGAARDLADELRRWLHHEVLTIRPATAWERARRWARRNRLAARVLAGAAAALLVGGGLLGLVAWDQRGRRHAAELREREATARAEAEARAGLEVDVRVKLAGAWERLREPTAGRRLEVRRVLGEVARSRDALAARLRDGVDLEVRSLYGASLRVPDVRVTEQADWPGGLPPGWSVALHPGGREAVLGGPQWPVRWPRGRPPTLPPQTPAGHLQTQVVYSPGGDYLVAVAGDGRRLDLWDGGVTRRLAGWKAPPGQAVLSVAFDAAGQALWACCDGGLVQLLTLPGLAPSEGWSAPPGQGRWAAGLPLGRGRLAAADEQGGVWLHDRAAGKSVLIHQVPGAVQALAWCPVNRLLAAGCKDGRVWLLHEDGRVSRRLALAAPGVQTLRFTPDGRWVIAGRYGATTRVWQVATGAQVLTLPFPAWDLGPGGVIFGGGPAGVGFAELLQPEGVRELSGHEAPVGVLAWAADGRHLASLDDTFEVRVWDARRGEPLDAFWPPSGGGAFRANNGAVSLSADGAVAAYASGGEREAWAVQHDVRGHRLLGKWRLPGGYEALAHDGRRFLLVREEEDAEASKQARRRFADAWVSRSVAYRWEVGQPPGMASVLRRPEPGDVRRFLYHRLTADGRYFAWLGPRLPPESRRAELYDLAAGKRALLVRVKEPPSHIEPLLGLCPTGSRLLLTDGPTITAYALEGVGEGWTARSQYLQATPLGRRWWWSGNASRYTEWPRGKGVLFRGAEPRPWLLLTNPDGSDPSVPSLSGDGRFLAWGSQSGTITVVDLPRLERAVAEFLGATGDAGAVPQGGSD